MTEKEMSEGLLVKMDPDFKDVLSLAADLDDTDMAKIVRRGIRRELVDLAERYPILKERMNCWLEGQSVKPSMQGV